MSAAHLHNLLYIQKNIAEPWDDIALFMQF
jgi:hypothetical protein